MDDTWDLAESLATEEESILTRDFGPLTNGANWTLVSIATLLISLRIYSQHRERKPLWWDGWMLVASWALLASGVAVTTANITGNKIGKHWYFWALNGSLNPGLGANISSTLAVVAAALAKISFAVSLLPLTKGGERPMAWFCIVTTGIATVVGVVMIWVQCTVQNWDFDTDGRTCMDPTVQAGLIAGFSGYFGLITIVLTLLPLTLLYPVRAILGPKEKSGVAVAMAMGLLAASAAFATCALTVTPRTLHESPGHLSAMMIWSTAEPALTIVAASIPFLRPLLGQATESEPSPGWKSVAEFQLHGGYIQEMPSEYNSPQEMQASPSPVELDAGYDWRFIPRKPVPARVPRARVSV